MADQCNPIRDEIAGIRSEIKGLQGTDSGQGGGPTQKPPAEQIRQLRVQLEKKLRDLAVCEGGPPNVFVGNDGGVYYLRFIGNRVFWFGENSTDGFANIFFGQKDGSEITGDWFDVPKGRNKGRGTISVHSDPGTNTLSRTAVTGGFGGTKWSPFISGLDQARVAGRGFHPAGFEAFGAVDLTGAWKGNDGGSYYLRQVDTTVVWFGESGGFSNVFRGTRDGNLLAGDWADVPKGGNLNSGTLAVAYDSATDTLSRTAVTGGFGGSQFSRVHA